MDEFGRAWNWRFFVTQIWRNRLVEAGKGG